MNGNFNVASAIATNIATREISWRYFARPAHRPHIYHLSVDRVNGPAHAVGYLSVCRRRNPGVLFINAYPALQRTATLYQAVILTRPQVTRSRPTKAKAKVY